MPLEIMDKQYQKTHCEVCGKTTAFASKGLCPCCKAKVTVVDGVSIYESLSRMEQSGHIVRGKRPGKVGKPY